jgi:hypothetical protein
MPQRTTTRLTAILLATLFLVSATKEALGLGCPHHEPAPAASDAAAATAPDGGHQTLEHHTPDHHTPDHHAPCTCIGHCCGAASAALASLGATRLPTQPAPSAGPFTAEPEADLPGPDPFTLPLANAPPHAL